MFNEWTTFPISTWTWCRELPRDNRPYQAAVPLHGYYYWLWAEIILVAVVFQPHLPCGALAQVHLCSRRSTSPILIWAQIQSPFQDSTKDTPIKLGFMAPQILSFLHSQSCVASLQPLACCGALFCRCEGGQLWTGQGSSMACRSVNCAYLLKDHCPVCVFGRRWGWDKQYGYLPLTWFPTALCLSSILLQMWTNQNAPLPYTSGSV